jgi:hypothetical protein
VKVMEYISVIDSEAISISAPDSERVYRLIITHLDSVRKSVHFN